MHSAAIKLDDSAAASPRPVWVQIASAGDFRGYPGGGFVFDRSTFDTIVANFRRNPSYAAGSTDVVPWDFNHASEMPPSSGSIPAGGTPAQGWVRDLAVRMGPKGAELWALTRWLDVARNYIKGGSYRWASVVVDFASKDPLTGRSMGPTLVSVALTNNPFVEGMQPLVAASRYGGRVAATRPALRNIGELRRVSAARDKQHDHVPFDPSQRAQQIGDTAIIGRAHDGSAATTISVKLFPDDPNGKYFELPGASENLSNWLSQYFPRSTTAELQALADQLGPIVAALTEEAAQLSRSTGCNLHQKAIVALRAVRPGYERLSWENQVREASRLVRRLA